MPRVRVPKSSRAASAGVSSNPDRSITNPTAVHTNGEIDFTHISNILEDAVDVLGNDKSKFATLEKLLKTVLEKVAQKKKNFLPPSTKKTRSRQNSEKRPHRHHLLPFRRSSFHR